MVNKCLQCSAKNNCCINGFAFVGIADAKRIQKFVGKEFSEFLDYSAFSKPMLRLLKEGDPVLESSLRYSLITDDKLLRLKKRKGQCVFLKNGECSIYEVRPKICRIYPYWCVKLLNGRIKVIDHDRNFCLVRNAQVLSSEDEIEMKKTFAAILAEAKYYKKHIRAFSEKAGL